MTESILGELTPKEAINFNFPEWVFEGRTRIDGAMAIDPDSTLLMEDVIDVKEDDQGNFIIQISVCDPTPIISPGSPFESEMISNLSYKNRTRFRQKLCFSLVANKPRPSITLSLKVDPETLEIKESKLDSTFITGSKRIVLESVEGILRCPEKKFHGKFSRIYNLAKRLEEEKLRKKIIKTLNPSQMVEIFMNLINTYVNAHLIKLGYPRITSAVSYEAKIKPLDFIDRDGKAGTLEQEAKLVIGVRKALVANLGTLANKKFYWNVVRPGERARITRPVARYLDLVHLRILREAMEKGTNKNFNPQSVV